MNQLRLSNIYTWKCHKESQTKMSLFYFLQNQQIDGIAGLVWEGWYQWEWEECGENMLRG
jgi:hypothetical protein